LPLKNGSDWAWALLDSTATKSKQFNSVRNKFMYFSSAARE
jgi:hypothetical protein